MKPKIQRSKWIKRTGWALLTVLGFVWLRSAWYAYSDQGIIVSKETTYLTEPFLDAENLDFRAGLNKLHSQGVTPENNAAVLLLQLVGPNYWKKEELEKVYHQLGLLAPPHKSVYWYHYDYIDQHYKWGEIVEEQEFYQASLNEQHDKAMWRPWSREEFPWLAKYYDANETSLELVYQAGLKPYLFVPQKDPDVLNWIRHLAEFISMHAFMMLHEEKLNTAIKDVLTTHRLARLLQSNDGTNGYLAGLAFDSMAFKVEVQLLASQKLTPQQVAYYLSERQKIGPLPSILEGVKVTDRVLMLESILDDWKLTVDDEDRDPWVSYRVDLNEILRNSNANLDQALLSVERPTHAERVQAAEKHEAQLSAAGSSVYATTLPFWLQSHLSRSKNTEQFSKLLLPLSNQISPELFRAEARGIARYRLVNLALLLETHRFQTNSYPETLEKLTVETNSKTMTDPFSDQPFIYKRTKTGYLLYSVGGNLKEDGGHEYDSEPPADDIKIQIE